MNFRTLQLILKLINFKIVWKLKILALEIMRIAHIVCRFPPYAGGMGLVAYEQVKRIAQNGHQVTVFTINQKQKLDARKINFKIKYLKSWPRLGNGGFCPQLFWQLRNFDIIQLHYPFFGAQELLWLTKKLKLIKAKLLIFYHMDASFNNLFVRILSFKSLLIRKSLFNMADKVCSASLDYVKHSKIKKIYHKFPEKFIEIPFGTNQQPERINQHEINSLKTKLNIKPDEKIILFVGGLDSAHYFKGISILIDAIKKINNSKARLIIVGDGNLRDDYERQVQGLNLQKQIIFTGRIEADELPYYYYLCHIAVLPSTTRAEAFGLVLVEAKTFAKPVIGSDLPGVRDVVGEAGLTAKPGDSADLAEKINKLLVDELLYQKFSQLAAKEVREKYNWDRHIEKLLAIYN